MENMTDFFKNYYEKNGSQGELGMIHSCPELMECIQQIGFLPLLESGIPGFCAEGMMDEDCRYVQFDDGSWEWPLWTWKGTVITESDCVYGKFFAGKAGFLSLEWWPDFYNWRRSQTPRLEPGSIEETIVLTLQEHGSLITRELRAACGFTGPKMRSKFDAYITRLQMACYIITEDFVYPTDKHGNEYGFGWSLLTTPEQLLGRSACRCQRTPEESHQRMFNHLKHLLPNATEKQINRLLK